MLDARSAAPSGASLLAVVRAFLHRDFMVARSYRFPFALNLAGILSSLIIFAFIAQLIDRADLEGLAGLDELRTGYFGFVVLGLALLRVVESTLSSFTMKMRSEMTVGTLEALLATPTSPALVILGSAAYPILQSCLSGLGMVLLAVPLGLRFAASPAAIVSVLVALPALLTLFAALGIVTAAFTIVFKQTQSLLGLITTGFAVLGGVYFPVGLLPAPLRLLAEALPFTWGLEVLRAALLRGEVAALRVALLVGWAVVGLPLALWCFRLAVDRARRSGSLGQY